jgi:hypothetical protein
VLDWFKSSNPRLIDLIAVAVIGAVIAGVVLGTGGGQSDRSSTPASTSTATKSTPSTATSSASTLNPPARPAYVSALTPSDGDTPQRGDAQLAGGDFPHSLTYENIASGQSTSRVCDNVPSSEDCRSTSYQVGGRYRTFTASFGLTQGANAAFPAQGQWRVSVDGQVVKQGSIQANVTPQPIKVSLGGGQVLELRTTVHRAVGDTATAVWGNVRVS